nr:hypothetical protein HAGR004_24160 [Bdellovibrio sp. HAGR004]
MIRSLLRSSVAVLSLCVLTACSSDSGENLTTDLEPSNCELTGNSYGIVGGQILGSGNELSASTVLIINVNKNEEQSICTGTLIANDKVLTAAHCAPSDSKAIAIAFTNNAGCVNSAPKRTLRFVVDKAVNEDYTESGSIHNATYDIAILKFKGGVPKGYKIRGLPSANFTPAPTDTLVMSGYGSTREKSGDSGTLRFTKSSASNILGNSFYLARANRTVSVSKTIVVEQPHTGVCSGDSGGALYAETKEGLTLLGITSMGVDHKALKDSDIRICHGVAIYVDVRENLDWIREESAKLDRYQY